MRRPLHHLALAATVAVTLVLLVLGSVVHATESSLACPDWPTCYGSWTPAMEGGVFWEHGHRLVAGLLLVLMAVAGVLTWRAEEDRPAVRLGAAAGFGLLVVQAVLGGLTVIFRLPDAISISHLAAAFLFLGLAVALTVVTSPEWREHPPARAEARRSFGRWTLATGILVYLQSLLGAAVRHADAGMACPDIPLCGGRLLPPLAGNPLVALHFAHRWVGVVAGIAVLVLAGMALRRSWPASFRRIAALAGVAALLQVALGFGAVASRLGVITVSLHTGFAALLIALLTAGFLRAREPAGARRGSGDPAAVGGGAEGGGADAGAAGA